jgi:hypothetical protein
MNRASPDRGKRPPPPHARAQATVRGARRAAHGPAGDADRAQAAGIGVMSAGASFAVAVEYGYA